MYIRTKRISMGMNSTILGFWYIDCIVIFYKYFLHLGKFSVILNII